MTVTLTVVVLVLLCGVWWRGGGFHANFVSMFLFLISVSKYSDDGGFRATAVCYRSMNQSEPLTVKQIARNTHWRVYFWPVEKTLCVWPAQDRASHSVCVVNCISLHVTKTVIEAVWPIHLLMYTYATYSSCSNIMNILWLLGHHEKHFQCHLQQTDKSKWILEKKDELQGFQVQH